jgi:DNA-binding transcriptional regulator YdaS (Cro superfamily)
MGKGLYIQSIVDAAEVAGGYDALAECLGVAPQEVRRWAEGNYAPPTGAFLRILEMLLEVPPMRREQAG